MQRTYDAPLRWAGLLGLMATLALLILPGASIAAPSDPARSGQASTGLLQQGSGYGTAAEESQRVRAVQRALRRLGWQPGPVDGRFGPRTESAVVRFQRNAGLAVDGIVGAATRKALSNEAARPLRKGVGYAQPNGSPRVKALQTRLRRAGLRPGPIDGVFGPRTKAAVTRLQRRGNVPATGVVTDRTRRVLAQNPAQSQPQPADTAPRPPREDRRLAAQVVEPATAERPEVATGTIDVPVAIGVGLLALLAGLTFGVLSGWRRGDDPEGSMPLTHDVVAEGESRSAGKFRGRVLALVSDRSGLRRAPEIRYLIDDPDKDGSFWVTHKEVTKLEPAPEAPAGPTRPAPLTVIGYVSAPDNGALDMQEQMQSIDALCEERRWKLLEVVRDENGWHGDALARPGLRYALERIDRGDGVCLVVAQLGALGHSVTDLDAVLHRLDRTGSRLVAVDVELDTGSPTGEVALRALRTVGSWSPSDGPPRTAIQDVPALKERIRQMRTEGMTLRAIADRLNEEEVPTLRGGREWRPSSVQSIAGYRRPRRDGNGGGP